MTLITEISTPPIDVRELAKLMRVSERTVWRQIAAGKVRTVRMGRAVRIPISEVRRIVGESEEMGTNQ